MFDFFSMETIFRACKNVKINVVGVVYWVFLSIMLYYIVSGFIINLAKRPDFVRRRCKSSPFLDFTNFEFISAKIRIR